MHRMHHMHCHVLLWQLSASITWQCVNHCHTHTVRHLPCYVTLATGPCLFFVIVFLRSACTDWQYYTFSKSEYFIQTYRVVSETIKLFHHNLLEDVQIGDQNVRLLSDIIPIM
jgi:hypothetical protein